MTTETQRAPVSMSLITPQNRQHKAIELHEKAIRHLKEAVRLHDAGDKRQANTHAAIANGHATSALLAGAGALNV
ncbi:MAG: hypothetical protein IPL15_21590 [Comamonadaceae bacterium]|jgi:hypothetical protein|uniref:hypothetical protein n=1 Tax=Candidatus Skiveiella danica TaxID=3386177 RepID=UPI001B4A226D|nr:hypothetical protein [Comamonadaceae bacterium]MBK9198319.1 hypothetical protein [Betaproteobacteria bacterium]MBP8101520.1 hypothetical protein [Burkholderiaceae bacterium]MBK6558674.1 hypothetical protein [Comamonadaceae bacterium]MBK6927446.1 hypothetical protein [Comamonadaceae bacterium]